MNLDIYSTKAERREKRKKNKEKMKVSGKSARLWNEIIIERAKNAENLSNKK